MPTHRLIRLAVAASALLAVLARPAPAQTNYVWNRYTGNGVWTDAANWLPATGFAPTADTLLEFGTLATAQTAAGYTSFFNAAFDINALSFTGTAGGATPIVLTGDTAASTLRFNPSTATTPVQPRISVTGLSPVTIQNGAATTGITLVGAGTRLQVVGSGLGQLNLAATIGQTGGAAGLDIDRGPAGAFGNATGYTVLSGANTFSGGVRLVSGNLILGSNAALGAGTLTIDGTDTSVGVNGSYTIANAVQLNQTLRLGSVVQSASVSTTTTFGGPIAGAGGITIAPPSRFPQFAFTGANTFTGALAIQPGALGGARVTLSGGGTMANASAYTVGRGATFTLDNAATSVSGRLNPNAVLTIAGGNFEINRGTGAVTETLRRLETTGGAQISLNSDFGFANTLTFTEGWVRGARSTLDATNVVLGGAPTSSVAGNIVLGANPGGAVGGGGAAGTPTRSILPYVAGAYFDGSLIVRGGLVAYDATTGRLESLATSEYLSNLYTLRDTNPHANVRLANTANLAQAGSVAGLFAPTTVSALVLSTYASATAAPPAPSPWRTTAVGPSVLGTGTLTVQSGVIVGGLFGPDFPNIAPQISVGTLNFGAATGYLHGPGFFNSPFAVNSPITGTGGLVVAGNWALTSLTSTVTGGVTVNGTLTIANEANLGPAGNGLTVNGTVQFYPEALYGTGLARTLTINRAVTLGTGATFSSWGVGGSLTTSTNNEIVVAGPVGGGGRLAVSTWGVVTLAGTANTFSGGVAVSGGVLRVAADGSLGAAGGTVTLSGGTFEPTGSFATAREFYLADQGGGRPNTIFTNGHNLTLTGPVTGGTASVANSPFTKAGLGTLELTAANPFLGAVVVGEGRDGFANWTLRVYPTSATGAQTAGTLKLSGPNGALAGATEFWVDSGATLHLDNSGPAANANNHRIGAVPVTLNGGELRLTGNANADVTQWAGTLRAGNPGSAALFNIPLGGTVTLDQPAGGGRVTTLTALGYTAVDPGVLFVRGTNLGGATGDRTRLVFANAPALTNGIIASMVGAADPTGAPTDFVTTVAVGGQREVRLFTGYTAGLPTAGGSTAATYDLVGGLVSLSGPVAANALRLGSGGGVNLNGQTLTLGGATQAGALLALPGNDGIAGGTLAFGTSPARVTVSGDTAFGNPFAGMTLTGSAGLIKFGPGVLTVAATNAITAANNSPTLVVMQGAYRLGSAAALPAASRVVIGAGATLDLNNIPAAVEDLSGYGTVNLGTGTLSLGGGSGLNRQFAGGFAGSGTLRTTSTSVSYTLAGHSPAFTGGVELLAGGLEVLGPTALGVGTSPVLLGNTTGTAFAFLEFGPAVGSVTRDITSQTAGGSSGFRSVSFAAAHATYSGTLTINAPETTLGNGSSGSVLTVTGRITGPGRLTIGSNNSHINLWGANDYTGGTAVSLENRMVLGVGTDTAFGTGPVNFGANATGSGGFLRADFGPRTIANAITTDGISELSVTGPHDLTFTGPVAFPNQNHPRGQLLTVVGTGRAVFTGALSGVSTFTLNKVGPGTAVLARPGGNPSLASPVSVFAGTLVANSTGGSSTGTGTVGVHNGAILAGGGQVGGATTVNAGGVVRPGATETGTETLTFDSSLTLAGGSTLQVNAAHGGAGRAVAQSVTVGGLVTIYLRDVGLQHGTPYSFEVLRKNTGGQFDLGQFRVISDFAATGVSLSQTGGSPWSVFVNFTPVPEPSAVLALAGAAAAGWLGVKRRRSARGCQGPAA